MIQLDIKPELLSQAIITTIEVKKIAKRVRVEFDYFEKIDKWMMAIYDAQSGESYCTNIPVIASYEAKNNLIEPYRHKNLGEVVCVPTIESPSSADPGKENMSEFAVIWGEEIA